MHVLIIGAGALGLFLGGLMVKGGGAVTYITRTAAQADVLNQTGVVVQTDSESSDTYAVRAYPFIHHAGQARSHLPYTKSVFEETDLVIVTTKQHHVDAVLPWINRFISKDIPVLFLMNGLGHQEKARQLEHRSIFYGMTQMGAFKTALNTVAPRGGGVTKIGSDRFRQKNTLLMGHTGRNDQQADRSTRMPAGIVSFLNLLRNEGLAVFFSDDIESELWKKCIVNACINPLTALFRVQNGALIEEPELSRLMHQLYEEAARLTAHIKPDEQDAILQKGELWAEIKQVCRHTAENYSSMLQDVQQGRPTEIDAITGYLLSQAQPRHVAMPYHQFLFDAIRFIEKQYQTV